MTLPRPPRRLSRFGILAAAHLLVALVYEYALGVRPPDGAGGEGWSGLWQTLPVEALTGAPLESVWNLHSQPPLYNLYGAVS